MFVNKSYLGAVLCLFALSSLVGRNSEAIQFSMMEEKEDCSFACKWIPPFSEILKPLQPATQNALAQTTVKVLAWNLYKGRKEFFFRDFQKLATNADIVMTSESTDGPLVKPAFDQISNYGWDMAISFYMKDDVATGLVTGSYAKPTYINYLRTKDKEPFVKSYKVILMTKYFHLASKQELLSISIHGINWASDDAFTRQIADVLPYIQKHKGPVIFAGDFNVNNSNRLKILQELLGSVGMARVPWDNMKRGKQLDDAFTRGVKVLKAHFNRDVVDASSDHPAMEFELEIPSLYSSSVFAIQ